MAVRSDVAAATGPCGHGKVEIYGGQSLICPTCRSLEAACLPPSPIHGKFRDSGTGSVFRNAPPGGARAKGVTRVTRPHAVLHLGVPSHSSGSEPSPAAPPPGTPPPPTTSCCRRHARHAWLLQMRLTLSFFSSFSRSSMAPARSSFLVRVRLTLTLTTVSRTYLGLGARGQRRTSP